METISLKMETKLIKDIDRAMKRHRYSTRTEFIRDAIRNKLGALGKEEAIRNLEKYFGKGKSKNKFSDRECRELAWKEYGRKYNLD